MSALSRGRSGRSDAMTGATIALTALTVAVAVGMGRLFGGTSYLAPFVAAAVVAHGAMWAGRRIGAPLPATALAALAGLGLSAAWLVLPETTMLGIPGPATLDAAHRALAEAWSEFGEVVAPAPVTDGFLLAGMVGIGATAVLADWAAFRMRVLFEALVPSFTLFVFTATLGSADRRGILVALYLVALLGFLVVHQAGLRAESTSWFASRSRGGVGVLLRGAAAVGAVAVVAAVVVGPRLPGASAGALVEWRDSDRPGGDGRRTTVSPLVDIRGRLVDRSTTEVFSVRTNERAYWRLTSLDTFDGEIWSSDASYRPVGRSLPTSGGTVRSGRVVQEFTIRSLASIWLPAAYRPEHVEGLDEVSYNEQLGSLITGEDTSDGLTYRVESAVPRPNATTLSRARGAQLPPAELARFLRLPPVSQRVRRQAQLVAAGSDGTPYGRALALQQFFRQDFTYDLQARPGHDGRALETFLFASRRGYCEQFAGAYAVMARTLGLPTRVAVGFTPGEMGSDGRLHVRGLNAHAWPEVHIAGSGWVAFEPTPGRGAPGAEAYTGVPEAQARPQDPTTATTTGPTATTAEDDSSAPPTTAAADEGSTAAGPDAAGRPLRSRPLVAAALVAVLVCLAVLGAVPAAKAARRRRRRAVAATPADRVWVAWTEAADAVGRAGAPRQPAETLDEHARRAAPAASLTAPAATALATLARAAATAVYAPGPLPAEVANMAAADAATVERAVTDGATRRQRLLWTFDPRPLLNPPRRGRRRA